MTKLVTFEKIVGGGMALGYADGKPYFAAGPLPGETAEVKVIKDKAGFAEAAVTAIKTVSAHRSTEPEEHYLCCSPWQNVDYDYQRKLKRLVLADAFARSQVAVPVTGLAAAPQQFGYRNKLEFSVLPGRGRLDLAFHARGSYEGLIALPEGCKLGAPSMNAAALALADRAHRLGLDNDIEMLTVRRSELTGEVLGHIALQQISKRDWNDLKVPELAGVVVSRVRGRANHELVWDSGQSTLVEKVGGLELAYPYDSFFQTNIRMFEQILTQIIKAVPEGGRLADIYGGVGTIGLAAGRIASEVLGVEINNSSVKLAEANAERAGAVNYRPVQAAAQGMDFELLKGVDCVVVDPPRAGLERRLINELLNAKPQRIIYLSCNPVTQARDWQYLSAAYHTDGVAGFDLYPGTLHLESLMILDRK